MKFFAIAAAFFFLPFISNAQFAAQLHHNAPATLHLNSDKQTDNTKYDWKRGIRQAILPGVLATASGVSGGVREALLWRKDVFFKRFPNANRNFFDTPVAYGADVPAGMQPYSKAHKVLTTAHNAFLGAAVVSATIPLAKHGKKQKLTHTLMDIGIQSLAISAGYFTGFEGVFGQFFKR
ncbi:MAG: hypothetical protein KGS48_00425 [Bacteroidetes bacterium]|nr:hypothetical protein [Bacteroidota bacterium]